RGLDQPGALERTEQIEHDRLGPAAQAAALRQILEPRLVEGARGEVGDPGAPEAAIERADQQQQAADRALLGVRQARRAAVGRRVAVIARAARPVAARPVLVAEVLEDELPAAPRVVR